VLRRQAWWRSRDLHVPALLSLLRRDSLYGRLHGPPPIASASRLAAEVDPHSARGTRDTRGHRDHDLPSGVRRGRRRPGRLSHDALHRAPTKDHPSDPHSVTLRARETRIGPSPTTTPRRRMRARDHSAAQVTGGRGLAAAVWGRWAGRALHRVVRPGRCSGVRFLPKVSTSPVVPPGVSDRRVVCIRPSHGRIRPRSVRIKPAG
jgi:hypothetical protein